MLRNNYTLKIKCVRFLRTSVCILLCLMCLIPFWMMFVNATRTTHDIRSSITLIPGTNLLKNIASLQDTFKNMDINVFRSMWNSLVIAAPSTLLAVYVSSLTAYGIFVYDFKLRKAAWNFIMFVMLVPGSVAAIGFYRCMLQMKLIDSYLPLILPAAASPSVVFFMHQYMKSALSTEMIEAARIDGAGEIRIFHTIITPLMKPAMATQAIFLFVISWNNLFIPSMILTTDSKKTLPMFVQILQSYAFKTDYGAVYVGLSVTVLPLFLIYFLLSRYIVAGVALGGVKE